MALTWNRGTRKAWASLSSMFASLVVTVLAPEEARACGGLFCDAGNPMPVDQAAEEVLFVRDGVFMETHIRVVYDGDVENFAWVIPLSSDDTPQFSVGSDALFGRLSQDSAVVASFSNQGGEDECNGWGGDGDGSSSGGGFVPLLDLGDAGEPPTVESQGIVGSFEFAVLSGGTVESLLEWLDANGYQQDPEAEPILEDYLMEGAKFAAVKLVASADNDAIHPIVVRYQGSGPCVPLRLTAIAAEEDMGVRLFALDEERLLPLNFEHVSLNWLRLENWSMSNYDELVTMAVDEAGGRAFVSEYVGPSSIVETWGLWESSWDASAFVDIEPQWVTQTLQQQGFMGHPLLASIMRQFLPAPPELDEQSFWNNLDEYASLIDQQAWSGPGFAAALDALIIQPGARANELLETRPMLSRLYTTISPHEMLEDPLFHYRADLGEVPRVRQGARVSECDELGVWTLEGRQLCENEYDTWPALASLPWSERVERVPVVGAPQVVFDHSAAIDIIVEAHNASTCGGPNPDPGTSSGSGSASGTSAGVETQGDSSESGASQDETEKGGCACSTTKSTPAEGFAFVVGLVAWRRRRR